MPKEIRDHILARMTSHQERNALIVELDYKTASEKGPKEILVLKPGIWGMNVDLKELWNRYIKS